jgi:CelD/BcsL family acetyltransferase involved in cellulose biosynthesis
VRVDRRPAAAFYGFECGRRLYYYLGGFDPEFARESAGSVAILSAIEHAAENGATAVDFLHGAESYKYRWGAVDDEAHRLSIRRGESLTAA